MHDMLYIYFCCHCKWISDPNPIIFDGFCPKCSRTIFGNAVKMKKHIFISYKKYLGVKTRILTMNEIKEIYPPSGDGKTHVPYGLVSGMLDFLGKTVTILSVDEEKSSLGGLGVNIFEDRACFIWHSSILDLSTILERDMTEEVHQQFKDLLTA